MKTPILLAFAFPFASLSFAQEAPPAAPPAAPAPQEAPATTAAPDLAGFGSEKERNSNALAQFFVTRDKQQTAMAPEMARKSNDQFLAGVRDVLSKEKDTDYAQGTAIAAQILRSELDVDTEVFMAALKDGLEGKEGKMTAEQVQAVMQQIQTGLQGKMEAKRKAAAEAVLKKAEEYMATNAKSEGVQTTASGLQYKIEKQGEGAVPQAGKLLTIIYKATNMDGKEFEKSPESGPARRAFLTLPKGMQEGLALIKVGGKAKFWVPPAIGYGEAGRLPSVKGNAILVYDVELVAAEPLPKPAASVTQPARQPVTAVTPPITVEIPPKEGGKPAPAPKPVEAPKPDAPPPAAPGDNK